MEPDNYKIPHMLYIDDDHAIARLLRKTYALGAEYRGSLCALFKTKGYLRVQRFTLKALKHANWLAARYLKSLGYTHPTYFRVESVGSNRLIDVQCKKCQKYVIHIRYTKFE